MIATYETESNVYTEVKGNMNLVEWVSEEEEINSDGGAYKVVGCV